MNPKINQMKNNMLSCPHCGAKPIVKNRSCNSNNFKVICSKDCQEEEDTWEDAINNWNKRTT